LSLIRKRYGRWGTNTKTSNIVTMTTKGCIPRRSMVMLCPEDPKCETIMEWDKKDECEIFGEALCAYKVDENKCIAIRVFDQIGGLVSGKANSLDTEQSCWCDENGVEFTTITTYDQSEMPPSVVYEQHFDNDGNIYTPVGKKVKGPLPRKIGFEICPPNATIDLEPDVENDIAALIPAGVTGAIVTFIKTNPCCTFKVVLDGGDLDSTGELISEDTSVCLGCTPESNGSPNDMKLFKIKAVDDCKARALIKFYKTKISK